MRVLVVGAGGTAREFLRRLGERWEVTVVDLSRQRLEAARGLRPFQPLRGDGSSRLTLRRAGLESADALVAATNDDDVNLEVCRIGREAGIHRLVAVAVAPERLPEFRELGVNAVSPASLAARRIELSLETRRISSVAFADGRAEAIEFRIAHDSPVRGKALKELHAASWTAGAILRGNRLVVPHGDTVLEEGDRVTVVGAGADFTEIVNTFTSGESRFPLDYGKRVAVAVEQESDLEGSVPEAYQLVRNSQASSLILVHRDPAGIREEDKVARLEKLVERAVELGDGTEVRARPVAVPMRALVELPGEESVGVIVVSSPAGGGSKVWWRIRWAIALVRRTSRPVLVARGSQPYRRIVVPARRTAGGRAAVRAAIDLARFAKGELLAVAAVDPVFISGPEAEDEARRAVAWVEEEAAVQGVNVSDLTRRGNPVRTLVEVSESADLVVLGVSAGPTRRLGRQDIGRLVARRTSRSALLVPFAPGENEDRG